MLDFCEHFALYTGRTDCKSYNESLAVMNEIKIESKISHEFFNVKNYIMNGYEMNSEFMTYSMTLNKNVFQRQSYKVAKRAITLRNSYLVNWSFMEGKKLTAYTIEPLLSTVFPYSEQEFGESSNPKDVFISMQFTQSDSQFSTAAQKEALANTFQRFGSFLALSMRFAGYLVGRWQKFSLDNSMMKKLYSYGVDDDDEDDDEKKRKKNKKKAQGGSNSDHT